MCVTLSFHLDSVRGGWRLGLLRSQSPRSTLIVRLAKKGTTTIRQMATQIPEQIVPNLETPVRWRTASSVVRHTMARPSRLTNIRMNGWRRSLTKCTICIPARNIRMSGRSGATEMVSWVPRTAGTAGIYDFVMGDSADCAAAAAMRRKAPFRLNIPAEYKPVQAYYPLEMLIVRNERTGVLQCTGFQDQGYRTEHGRSH